MKLKQLPTDDAFAYVGHKAMKQYLEQSQNHPLNCLASLVWTDSSSPKRQWIYHPHVYIKNNGNTVRNDVLDLQPPFSWLVYDSNDVPIDASIMILSEPYRNAKAPIEVDPSGETDFPTYIDMLHTRRILVQGLFRIFPISKQYCHHAECEYYESGLCNGYLRIPADFLK